MHFQPQSKSDYCTRAGAESLAARIHAYWLARGHDIKVWIEERGFDPKMRAASCDVRTNLVNGHPQGDHNGQ